MSKYGLKYERKTEACIEALKTHHVFLTEADGGFVRDPQRHPNLLIEGENYHALKALTFTHTGKVDVIEIDPPYNTGNNDFVYDDRFVDQEDTFRHSKWLSFMSERLELAKELLSERGVIFMHIDDNEFAQLKLLCDQVFGEDNFVANLIWKKRDGGGNDSKYFAIEHEYILCYAKNIKLASIAKLVQDVNSDTRYKFEDDLVSVRGKYLLEQLQDGNIRYSPTLDYAITAPDGSEIYPDPDNRPNNGKWLWRWNRAKFNWGLENGFITFKEVKKKWKVYTKQYQLVNNNGEVVQRTSPMRGILDFVNNSHSRKELQNIFGVSLFDYAKPVELIKRLLFVASQKDSIILDFFAGSGTTGQAVAELNQEDGGTRQFILCTNNDKSEKLPQGICRQVCLPRLEKTIGQENLKVFQLSLLPKEEGIGNQIQQLELNDRLVPTLQVLHNTFTPVEQIKHSHIFTNTTGDKHLAIYSNSNAKQKPINTEELKHFKQHIKQFTNSKLVINRPRHGFAADYVQFMKR